MSENLNLLRQQYCRLGSFTGKRTDHLFPLEKQCEEGKALLATAPKTSEGLVTGRRESRCAGKGASAEGN
jgi:hypothetical protein